MFLLIYIITKDHFKNQFVFEAFLSKIMLTTSLVINIRQLSKSNESKLLKKG